MSAQTSVKQSGNLVQFEDPPVTKFLFSDVRLSWLWLIIRLYVGYEWVVAGWAKVQNPAWFGSGAGAALAGFLKGALTKSTGAHPDVQGWYATFLQNMVLPNVGFWSNFVAVGEVLVGVALILGLFTGIAAFFGSFMNFNYLLAGTVSTNPVLFLLAMLIILAWKTAGWLGLDRWVLPLLGTPWTPGKVFKPGKNNSQERKTGEGCLSRFERQTTLFDSIPVS